MRANLYSVVSVVLSAACFRIPGGTGGGRLGFLPIWGGALALGLLDTDQHSDPEAHTHCPGAEEALKTS